MSACPSPLRRLALGLAGVAVLALGACTSAAADMTPVTVTVFPPELTQAAPSEEPTPVPTVYADGSGPDRTLRAGHLRGVPSSPAEARSRVESARTAESVQGLFLSPTGNIFCNVIRDGAAMACEVAEGRVAAPSEICDGSGEVSRLELTAERVVGVCGPDSIRDGTADGAPRLRYGYRTIVAGTPIQCLSEKTGITCVDTSSGRGFFVAKGTFATF